MGDPAVADRYPLELTVNGRRVRREVPGSRTLLECLRGDLRLTGTNLACDTGDCGACTVLVDGRPATACLVLALDVDGAEVTTIEGLRRALARPLPRPAAGPPSGPAGIPGGGRRPVRLLHRGDDHGRRRSPRGDARAERGRRSGPGSRGTSAGAPATSRSSAPSRLPRSACARRGRRVSGSGSHPGRTRQPASPVRRRALRRAGAGPTLPRHRHARRQARRGGEGDGRGPVPPRPRDARAWSGARSCGRRSPTPASRGSTRPARRRSRASSGVVTGRNVEQRPFGYAKDHLALKPDVVRCIRDEVAAVAAETEEIAAEACRLIDVEYEELPAVFDPEAALGPGGAPDPPAVPGQPRQLHLQVHGRRRRPRHPRGRRGRRGDLPPELRHHRVPRHHGGDRPVGPAREPHDVVDDPDPVPLPEGPRRGARDLRGPRPRHPAAGGRQLRAGARPLPDRHHHRAPGPARRPAGEDRVRPRGGVRREPDPRAVRLHAAHRRRGPTGRCSPATRGC